MAEAKIIKMECPICFHEANSFKILQCGHHFCVPCIDQLRFDNVNSAADSERKTKDMECPQCRQITPSGGQLKTKFMSNLMCRECDEEKLVEEFRWCYHCSLSVCSKCFVDKHMITNKNGELNLHKAAKWDADYPAVKHCVGQLKREGDGFSDRVKRAQEYLASYLEGFQEYMSREIEQRIRSSNGQCYATKIAALGRSYDVDVNAIEPANQLDKNYEILLNDLCKVAKLNIDDSDATSPEAFSEIQLKMTCLPYKSLADILLGTVPQPQPQPRNESANAAVIPMETSSQEAAPGEDPPPYSTMDVDPVAIAQPAIPAQAAAASRRANISPPHNNLFDPAKNINIFLDVEKIGEKLASTTVVRPDVIKQPADVCYFPAIDALLITEHTSGIFLLKNCRTLDGPLVTAQRYNRYSRITPLPLRLIQSAAMVHVQLGAVWYYAIVIVNDQDHTEMIKLHNKPLLHCNFPTPRQPTTASSERSLFCLTSQSLFRYVWPEERNSSDWHEVYSVTSASPPHAKQHKKREHHQQGRLGPIIERHDSTEIYLINSVWQSVDIVTLRHADFSLIAVNRVELKSFFPATPLGNPCGFIDPFLVKINNTDNRALFLLADKKQANSYVWNKDEKTLKQWHNFSTKAPQKIICHDNKIFLICENLVASNVRALEMVIL